MTVPDMKDLEVTGPHVPAILQFMSRNKLWVLPAMDSIAWGLAIFFAVWIRFDFRLDFVDPLAVGSFALVAMALQHFIGQALRLYGGHYRFGSFDEVSFLALTVTATTGVLFAADSLMTPRSVPLSSTLGAGVAALVGTCATRYVWRYYLDRALRPTTNGRKRMLVFGAGEAANQVITAMLRDPSSPYVPVALLDDDWHKRHLRIMGVHVEGTRNDLAQVAKMRQADELLVAITTAGRELITQLTDLAKEAGLKVKVLPPVAELFGAGVTVKDIRPISEEDLLGRRKIDTDIESIAGYLTGKRVLVTGAGGSIGSELCRQIKRFEPAELMMLDRDESVLHAVQLSIDGRGLLESPDLILCDIRDHERVRQIMSERRPDVVFHSAALKHLPLLEHNPQEALKTNVFGTLCLLEAAADIDVERFVNISTDKAADPCSVLGFSKRICEMLTSHFSTVASGTYISVRFGNVLGSRGSMLETFRAQIAAGGPVTVTDPHVARYFMTVEEAVQLVVQAGAIGREGEVLVLDMGDPVRIIDVAERLVAQADEPIEIVLTGLRPGEKLDEALLGAGEADVRPVHNLIAHTPVPPLHPSELPSHKGSAAPEVLIAEMQLICSTTNERVSP